MAEAFPSLTRSAAAAPERIAHLGLGAFARSHQAWYTDVVNDLYPEDPWGITGFTGRTPDVANALQSQGGLYHLVSRGETDDDIALMRSVATARDGADIAGFLDVLSRAETAVVTLTVSEAGYHIGEEGDLNTDAPAVRDDLRALSQLSGATDAALRGARGLSTMPARLALALEARRRAGGAPIALVPCDNLASNGTVLRRALHSAAEPLGDELVAYLHRAVTFVDTSVDRITPATTHADRELIKVRTGFFDRAPVVAETFTDWVLSGSFPAGRPAWEHAGARFVDDIEPFERRKLWLLNGAHSLMAYSGLLADLRTVDEAIRDSRLRQLVVSFWDEAAHSLPAELNVAAYLDALLTRFENPRIAHSLRQISAEGSTKIRQRIVPVLFSSRALGRPAHASVRAIAAWIVFVMRADRIIDARSEELLAARTGPFESAVDRIAAIADERLSADDDVRAGLRSEVRAHMAEPLGR